MKKLTLIFLVFFFTFSTSQKIEPYWKLSDEDKERLPFLIELMEQTAWVDSVLNTMTPDERIGQLFMIPAYSNKDSVHIDSLSSLIQQYNIGGVIFFQGGPVRQALMCNKLQSVARIPLLIGIDAEWGLAMRLDSTMEFPKENMLGAVDDDKLIYEMGKEIARQCKRLGIHINFAPVVDINSNPNNPVINDRSFGENKMEVTHKGLAYMLGMQEEGVLACAKHFPGHGDTDKDSHKTLPVVSVSRERLDTLELFPFKELFKRGTKSVMVAHLNIPALDTSNVPSSLSRKVVNSLLKEELKFDGLIFTDALNMKGATSNSLPDRLELRAFLAGNDIMLYPQDLPKAIEDFKSAVHDSLIAQKDIDERVKKILRAKYSSGLNNYRPIVLVNLYDDLNNPEAELLRKNLIESALTVVNNKNDFLPITTLDTIRFASVSIGSNGQGGLLTPFQEYLDKYAPFTHFQIKKGQSEFSFDSLLNVLQNYNVVVVGLHDMSRWSTKDYGVSVNSKLFLKKLQLQTKVVFALFGNPYSLQSLDIPDWTIVGYDENKTTQSLAAQLIFGGIPGKGKLPITVPDKVAYNSGFSTIPLNRLKYTTPEEVGIHSKYLLKIDSIANDAIAQKAFPGCVIQIVKDGKVFYEKAFGSQTYEDKTPVKISDIYDIASITKIAATTISLMKLEDDDAINVKRKLDIYLPEAKETNKQHLHIDDILTHQAGLKSWIPFYLNTLKDSINVKKDDNSYYKENIYSSHYNEQYTIRVAENLFMNKNYVDSIWVKIFDSPVKAEEKYLYSDLGFYLMRRMIEHITHKPIEKYTRQNFYAPLGLSTMGYLPRERFPLERIVPTENDNYFRHQLLRGDVHDMGAAMLGGISGHAGLFSNANDLAIIGQMLLNKGEYGGKRYLKSKTVDKFTEKHSPKNRRGLGFDKPEPDVNLVKEKGNPTSGNASPETFGHQGFTGTCIWVDPKYNLVYVFLSNRTYPTMKNEKLNKLNVRTNIQQVIYDAMEKNN